MKKPSKPKFDFGRILEFVGILSVVGGTLTLLNFQLMTPADALEANFTADSTHVIQFEHHVDDFTAYLDGEAEKDVSRAQRTELMEAQTRLTCLRTGRDTLALAGLIQTCDSLIGR